MQTSSFVLSKVLHKEYSGIYCRLIDADSVKKEVDFLNGDNRYIAKQINYECIPDMPISYHLSEAVYNVFRKGIFLKDYGNARQGLTTSDNTKFLRMWSEVCWNNIAFGLKRCEDTLQRKERWYPYIKGGAFRRWYPNKEYVVNYQNNGAEIKNSVMKKYLYLNNPDFVVKNTATYFKAGITWSDVATGKFSARWVEEGSIYADVGPMFFARSDYKLKLCYMNSIVFQLFGDLICQGIHYSTGQIPQIPYQEDYDNETKKHIENMSDTNIKISEDDWNAFETSWDFVEHPLVGGKKVDGLIATRYNEWKEECDNRFKQLKTNEEELNRIFIGIYGLQDELTPKVEDKDVTVRKADLQRDIKSLLSYAVGCMFGRYSLDVEGLAYAGGEWDDSKYSTFIPDKDNIILITDEEYFEDDIFGLFCSWLKKVYGEDTLEENLGFIASALGNKGNTSRDIIRNYFIKDFFKDHCATYSVTGSGKRPIYWLFDSGKQNGFKALIYLHRYNVDSIGNLRVDYLHRMQRIYDSEIERMQDMIEHCANSREGGAAAKRKEKLQKQLKECRDYDEKIGHLALSRIELDLDDGVKVNYEKVQTAKDGKKYHVLAKI